MWFTFGGDEATRYTSSVAMRLPAGTLATLWLDPDCSIPASGLRWPDGTAITGNAVEIVTSLTANGVTVPVSYLPFFIIDGIKTLFVRVGGGPAWKIRAFDANLDADEVFLPATRFGVIPTTMAQGGPAMHLSLQEWLDACQETGAVGLGLRGLVPIGAGVTYGAEQIKWAGMRIQRRAGSGQYHMLRARLTDTLGVTSGPTVGLKWWDIVIDGNAAIDNLLQATPAHRFAGMHAGQVTGEIDGYEVTGTVNTEIQGGGLQSAGLFPDHCTDLKVRRFVGHDNLGTALYGNYSTGLHVDLATTERNDGSGISSNRCDEMQVHHATNRYSLYSGVSLNGLRCKGSFIDSTFCQQSGLNVGHGLPSTNPSDYTTLAHCLLTDNGLEGLSVENTIGGAFAHIRAFRNATRTDTIRSNIQFGVQTDDCYLEDSYGCDSVNGRGITILSGKHRLTRSRFKRNGRFGGYVDGTKGAQCPDMDDVDFDDNGQLVSSGSLGCLLDRVSGGMLDNVGATDTRPSGSKTQESGLKLNGCSDISFRHLRIPAGGNKTNDLLNVNPGSNITSDWDSIPNLNIVTTRPAPSSLPKGTRLWDNIRHRPIYTDGSNWIDSTGVDPDVVDYLTSQQLLIGEATMPGMMVADDQVTRGSRSVRLSYWTARRTEDCTQIRVESGNTAWDIAPNLVRVGVYLVDLNTGNLTLIAAIDNDPTMLGATLTPYVRPFTTTPGVGGSALSTVFHKVAGVRYATGELVRTSSVVPTGVGSSKARGTGAEAAQDPRVAGVYTSQDDLPAAIAGVNVQAARSFLYSVVLP